MKTRKRFYYTIQDPNNLGYEQEWSVSKRTLQQIDALLMEGYTLLKVERKNSKANILHNHTCLKEKKMKQ